MKKLDLPKDKLANGPVMKRNCTDCICCVIFLMFCVGMVGTALFGFINGDPYMLLTAWDYDCKLLLLTYIISKWLWL